MQVFVTGGSGFIVDVDEDTVYPHSTGYPHAVSKRRAEQIVRAASAADFETVCIGPVMVWGPNDTSILPQLVEMVDSGTFLWVDRGKARVDDSCRQRRPTGQRIGRVDGWGSRARPIRAASQGLPVPSNTGSPAPCTS